MKHSPLYIALVTLLSLVGSSHSRGEGSPVFEDSLVSPAWIEAHADDPEVLIVDVSMNPRDYQNGHIPGAVFICWNQDLSDENREFYRVPTQEQFEAIMSRIGASPETQLIFYDNGQNRFAIRALWVARYFGHANSAILEGGVAAWEKAGLPLVTERPKREPTDYLAQEPRDDMDVSHEFVAAHLRDENVRFVDSRPWNMFTGEKIGVMIDKGKPVARIGHLPGAESLPWKSNLDTDASMFLPIEALRTLYQSKGIDDESTTVFYCNEGLHAAFNWFVATEILGLDNIRIYEGSMGEWASEPTRPLVSGIGF